jgi:hypothetical protein
MKYLKFITVFISLTTYGQKYDYTWIIGLASGVPPEPQYTLWGPSQFEFTSDTVKWFRKYRPHDMIYSSLAASDSAGQLIFYTDWVQVYDTLDSVMINGSGLNPGYLAEEDIAEYQSYGGGSGIVIPMPGCDSLYYLFHSDWVYSDYVQSGGGDSLFLYTVVDMSGNGGLGKVISKNNQLENGYILGYGGLAACKHANGRDWWIVIPKLFTNCLYIYLLTPHGIDSIGLQCMGDTFATNTDRGQSCFTPDGSKYIWGNPYDSLHIIDFDRCTGIFTDNLPRIPVSDSLSTALQVPYFMSVSVSPNSRFLYVGSGTELWQYDLWSDSISQSVILIKNMWQTAPFSSTLCSQLGPDGKIYIAPIGQDTFFNVINTPDSPGLACNFKVNGLLAPTFHFNAMPIYPNYRLGALTGSPCDTLRSACTITDTTINISICKGQSYSFGDSIYSQSASYSDTLQNSGGCDSIINLQLTVLANSFDSITAYICAGQSYSVGSFTHNQPGFYADTLQNMNDCDSIVYLQLSVLAVSSDSIAATICKGQTYTLANGTYNQSGLYSDTLQGSNGCDSTVFLQLTVDSVMAEVSQPTPDTLIATGNGNITWLNCDSDQLIEGAIFDTFVPKANGNYSAIVTSGNCSDTSECFTAIVNSIQSLSGNNDVHIYPNPTSNKLYITLTRNVAHTMLLYDLNGALLASRHFTGTSEQLDLSGFGNGVYFIAISAEAWSLKEKVVKME